MVVTMTDEALQQYLPFTVLKLSPAFLDKFNDIPGLQQYLPFTVLKLNFAAWNFTVTVATVPTVYGIETVLVGILNDACDGFSCNSTYRLRY